MSSGKKQIKLKTTLISDNEIRICSDSTVFCLAKNIDQVNLQDVLDKYSAVIRLAKQRSIPISYANHFKKTLREIASDYCSDVKDYQIIFAQLKEGWKEKVIKGIDIPAVDDKELNELENKANQLTRLLWQSMPISKVNFIKHLLESTLTALENGRQLEKVYL